MQAAEWAETSNRFEFFFYEKFENERLDGQTVCESIFKSSGLQFDALFVFFKERVGQGTIEELDYFESTIIPQNPRCKIWWTSIHCDERSGEANALVDRLLKYNTGLPIVGRELKIETPIQLAGRLTVKCNSVNAQMLSGTDAP